MSFLDFHGNTAADNRPDTPPDDMPLSKDTLDNNSHSNPHHHPESDTSDLEEELKKCLQLEDEEDAFANYGIY